MFDPNRPTPGDDAASLAGIVLPALVSFAVTGSILSAIGGPPERELVIDLSPVEIIEEVDPAAGAERIYGRAVLRDGTELEGYLRWDGRDASWADVLQATRTDDNSFSGVRFGHIRTIEPVDARTARVTLKSGEVVELSALLADGQTTLRPLAIEAHGRPGGALVWRDVERVELLPEPIEDAPGESRLHGTLVTRSGLTFTGYLTWDQDKRYATDLLDGDAGTGEGAVPFAEIAAIHYAGPDEALVTLRDGATGIVRGTTDVGASNRGITVADPAMGLVVVPWNRFEEVRLHPPTEPLSYEAFDGGAPLRGTVVTRDGTELQGRILWDRDEGESWELLDGQLEGMRMRVELGQIVRIRKFRFGAAVDLRDGRTFYLSASQDVNWTNRGIQVEGDGTRIVPWDDFSEVRFGG